MVKKRDIGRGAGLPWEWDENENGSYPMGILIWESYGNYHMEILWESYGNYHMEILWESYGNYHMGILWESYGNYHRNPVGMGWKWELKFLSHGNPGGERI